jgi:hypothetical protein
VICGGLQVADCVETWLEVLVLEACGDGWLVWLLCTCVWLRVRVLREQGAESVRQLTLQVRFLQDELDRGQAAANSAAKRSADQLSTVKVCVCP